MRPPSPIFLSHNSRDKPVVEAFAHAMKDVGLVPWFDKWDFRHGRPWQPQLVEAITRCSLVWVFVGPHGPGRWQDIEVQQSIDAAVADDRRLVVPILFRGADLGRWDFLGLYDGLRVDLSTEPPTAEDDRKSWLSSIRAVVDQLRARLPPEACEPSRHLVADSDIEPYRGLRAFDAADAEWMFGREDEIHALLQRLRDGQRFLCLSGASGSGKSSLVRAGVVPAVRSGQLDGNYAWRTLVVRPGATPCLTLARALVSLRTEDELSDAARSKEIDELAPTLVERPTTLANVASLLRERHRDAPNLLLIVDQLEELFTETRDDRDRQGFICNLLGATTRADVGVTVVATLRADFIGECLGLPGLDTQLEQSLRFVLPPMKRHQLFDAIVRPAARLGVQIDSAVRDDLLRETVGQTGQLPLLQFALAELWKHREGDRLTYESYARFGKIRGAIAQTANDVVAQMEPSERAVAMRLLGRLVHPGAGTGDTRRRAFESEIDTSETTKRVLERLTRSRLVTRDDETFDIAHEVLIQEWGELRRVLNDRREALPVEQQLAADCQTWLKSGRDPTELWSGGRLTRALELDRLGKLDLAPSERDFLEASEAMRRAVIEREIRRTRMIWTGMLAGLAALTALTGFAFFQWRSANVERELALELANERDDAAKREAVANQEAQRRRQDAEARSLAFAAHFQLDAGRPVEAMLLAIEATRNRPASDASRVTPAFAALLAGAHTLGTSRAYRHDVALTSASFSPEGTRILTAAADGTARVWRVDGAARPIVLAGHTASLTSASFSPDGTRILTASMDGTARLWHSDGSGTPRVLDGHASALTSASFSPDGARIITASLDRTARVRAADGSGDAVVLRGHTDAVASVAFGPDGTRVVTASHDGTARVWRVDGSGKPVVLRGHTDAVAGAAFSPDGTRVVTASHDGTARVWKADGAGKPIVLRGHAGRLTRASFSADGARILTTSVDGTARVWSADGSGESVVLRDHESKITGASFSADGARIVTASDDHSVHVWSADGSGEPVVLRGHEDGLAEPSFSLDGTRILSASADGTARLWDARGSGEPVVFRADAGSVDAAFSPDGARIIMASGDGAAHVWRADGSGEPVVFRADGDARTSVSFSPDGSSVVTASKGGTARVWKVDGSGEPIVLRGHAGAVTGVSFSADGTRIVTASDDETARVWRADGSGEAVVLRGHSKAVTNASFSVDGTRIVTASEDGTARVWRADGSGEAVVLRGHSEAVTRASFSPDGTRIVTVSRDGTARVWAADGAGEPVVLRSRTGVVTRATFSPDGTRILAASSDLVALVWSLGAVEAPIVLGGHTEPVTSASFSPDGTRVLTASHDRTARIWNADGLGEPVVLRGHVDEITSASFSPDGARVLTVSADGFARVWTVDAARLAAIGCNAAGRNLTCEEWRRATSPDTPYHATCERWPSQGPCE